MFFDGGVVLRIGFFEFEIHRLARAGERLHECDALEMDFRALAHFRKVTTARGAFFGEVQKSARPDPAHGKHARVKGVVHAVRLADVDCAAAASFERGAEDACPVRHDFLVRDFENVGRLHRRLAFHHDFRRSLIRPLGKGPKVVINRFHVFIGNEFLGIVRHDGQIRRVLGRAVFRDRQFIPCLAKGSLEIPAVGFHGGFLAGNRHLAVPWCREKKTVEVGPGFVRGIVLRHRVAFRTTDRFENFFSCRDRIDLDFRRACPSSPESGDHYPGC